MYAVALIIVAVLLIVYMWPRESFSPVAMQELGHPKPLHVDDEPRQVVSFDDYGPLASEHMTVSDTRAALVNSVRRLGSAASAEGMSDCRTRAQIALGPFADRGEMCPELISVYQDLGWMDGSVSAGISGTGELGDWRDFGEQCYYTGGSGHIAQQLCSTPPRRFGGEDYAPLGSA